MERHSFEEDQCITELHAEGNKGGLFPMISNYWRVFSHNLMKFGHLFNKDVALKPYENILDTF